MKMRLVNRISIMVLAVLGVLAAFLIELEMLGGEFFETLKGLVSRDGRINAAVLIPATLILIAIAALSVQVFMIALRNGKGKSVRLITLKGTKGDAVMIAQETLDQMVKDIIGEPDGVTDVQVVCGYADRKVDVLIDMAVASNIEIPATTRAIQDIVRNQLVDVNGIEISGVNVKISKINVIGGEKPCAVVKADEPAEETQEAALEETEAAAEVQEAAPIAEEEAQESAKEETEEEISSEENASDEAYAEEAEEAEAEEAEAEEAEAEEAEAEEAAAEDETEEDEKAADPEDIFSEEVEPVVFAQPFQTENAGISDFVSDEETSFSFQTPVQAEEEIEFGADEDKKEQE